MINPRTLSGFIARPTSEDYSGSRDFIQALAEEHFLKPCQIPKNFG